MVLYLCCRFREVLVWGPQSVAYVLCIVFIYNRSIWGLSGFLSRFIYEFLFDLLRTLCVLFHVMYFLMGISWGFMLCNRHSVCCSLSAGVGLVIGVLEY